MDFVLDASIALAWCFSDEATPTTTRLLESLSTATAHVPSLWPLELGNILISAEKRRRITYADMTQFLGLIKQINIEIDSETAQRGLQEILSRAHSEKLTTYDAAYLELAMRKGLPLASKDEQLCEAAGSVGVKLISCL